MDGKLAKIAYDALCMACKFMRDNPPGDLDMYRDYPGLIDCLIGGSTRDPDGKEYVQYFMSKALEKNLGM